MTDEPNAGTAQSTSGTERSRDEIVSVSESFEMTAEATEKHEVCPECECEYVDLDVTMSGKLVFVHRESPLMTCTAEPEADRDV